MKWQTHLYAIVSADDCIADEHGAFPASLMNEADWSLFQKELDGCRFVVLGRRSHEATPNKARRLRAVMSRSSAGLEQRGPDWWWNPAVVPFASLAEQLAPGGGKVGVPGGQDVFDLFLRVGFSAFHLTRARRVFLPGGRKVFSGAASAETQLAACGLVPGETVVLDAGSDVVQTIWRHNGGERQ